MIIKKLIKQGVNLTSYEYNYPGFIRITFNEDKFKVTAWIKYKEGYLYETDFEIEELYLPNNWIVQLQKNEIIMGFKEAFENNFFENLLEEKPYEYLCFMSRCDDNYLEHNGYYKLKSKIFIEFTSRKNIKLSKDNLNNIHHFDLILNKEEFKFNITEYSKIKLTRKDSYIDKSLGAKLNGSVKVGFFMHIKDGYLIKIEGYTFGENWPEKIETIEFFEI